MFSTDSQFADLIQKTAAALLELRKVARIEGEVTPLNIKPESDEGLQVADDEDEGQNIPHSGATP